MLYLCPVPTDGEALYALQVSLDFRALGGATSEVFSGLGTNMSKQFRSAFAAMGLMSAPPSILGGEKSRVTRCLRSPLPSCTLLTLTVARTVCGTPEYGRQEVEGGERRYQDPGAAARQEGASRLHWQDVKESHDL
jgi:hypothetical protein